MLRNLGIISMDTQENAATLGFSSPEGKQKANWYTILGAGKSKRKHVFMGFTKEEEQRLTKLVYWFK